MAIVISNTSLQIDNSIYLKASCERTIELIKNAVQTADISSAHDAIFSTSFFENEDIHRHRATNGVVETPKAVAEFIVSLAYRRWCEVNQNSSRQPNELHWLDPCSGAGVFSCAIVNHYINELHVRRVCELPLITVSEISPLGLTSTLCSIRLEIEKNGLDFSEYLNSKRLILLLGDSLQFFPECRDIFYQANSFDLVVGNPPYVRSTRITADYKRKLGSLFPGVFNGSADLYTYFVTSGLASLVNNGVLAFISPAAFSRAKSGQALREWLKRTSAVDSFIDLDETKIFKGADLHTAIYVLIKGLRQPSKANYLHIKNSDDLARMCNGQLSPKPAIFENPIGHGWAFHSSKSSLQTFSKMFAGSKTLNELGVTVYSGIRTGHSKTYLVDSTIYEQFTPDIRSRWFKPTILPANIKRWYGAKEFHFMLTIPAGIRDIDDELLKYLLPFKKQLSSRTEVRRLDEWFTLRPCSYYSKMDVRKIAFPDLSAQQRFSLVEGGVYIPDGAYFIDTDSLVLLGILNTRIARKYFVKRCSSVGSLASKGRFRFKKAFVQNFPVPPTYMNDGPTQTRIKQLVLKLIKKNETEADVVELDQLVSQLYHEAK